MTKLRKPKTPQASIWSWLFLTVKRKKKKNLIDSNDSNSIYFEPNMVKLSNRGGSLSSQIENA